MPEHNEGWVEKFDEKFPYSIRIEGHGNMSSGLSYHGINKQEVKDFIRTLLASERQRTVERLREAVRKSHIGITFADGHKIYKAAMKAIESEASKLLADE